MKISVFYIWFDFYKSVTNYQRSILSLFFVQVFYCKILKKITKSVVYQDEKIEEDKFIFILLSYQIRLIKKTRMYYCIRVNFVTAETMSGLLIDLQTHLQILTLLSRWSDWIARECNYLGKHARVEYFRIQSWSDSWLEYINFTNHSVCAF